MTASRPTRADQRAASKAALLDAAVELYAQRGPDGVSLRQVAQSVGLTHALVAQYFGSKEGLVSAVEGRLAAEIGTVTDAIDWSTTNARREVLAEARKRPAFVRLLVRSGLGDLDGAIVPAVIAERCATTSNGDRRGRICGYASTSLLLGWLSWEGFLVPGLELSRMSHRRRDEAIAAAATSVWQLATLPTPNLAPRQLGSRDTAPAAPPARSAREALLAAAVQLFAEHGPASVSIRDIARYAGVNHGLVHRHFGSKVDLLAEAIEVGSGPLQSSAFPPDGFDIDGAVHAIHQGSPSARTIARLLVDAVAVETVRRHYPVLDGLLELLRQLPADERPLGLGEPRLAAAAGVSLVVGSAIWGPGLRDAFGISDHETLESAIADISHWLLGAPDERPKIVPQAGITRMRSYPRFPAPP